MKRIMLAILIVFAGISAATLPPTHTDRKTELIPPVVYTRPPETTTTLPPPTTTTIRAYRSKTLKIAPKPVPEAVEGDSEPQTRTMQFTAYCLQGTMASGKTVYENAVASNEFRLGARLYVPELDRHFIVEDRHSKRLGPRIDVWMPSCHDAIQFGSKHYIVIIE